MAEERTRPLDDAFQVDPGRPGWGWSRGGCARVGVPRRVARWAGRTGWGPPGQTGGSGGAGRGGVGWRGLKPRWVGAGVPGCWGAGLRGTWGWVADEALELARHGTGRALRLEGLGQAVGLELRERLRALGGAALGPSARGAGAPVGGRPWMRWTWSCWAAWPSWRRWRSAWTWPAVEGPSMSWRARSAGPGRGHRRPRTLHLGPHRPGSLTTGGGDGDRPSPRTRSSTGRPGPAAGGGARPAPGGGGPTCWTWGGQRRGRRGADRRAEEIRRWSRCCGPRPGRPGCPGGGHLPGPHGGRGAGRRGDDGERHHRPRRPGDGGGGGGGDAGLSLMHIKGRPKGSLRTSTTAP